MSRDDRVGYVLDDPFCKVMPDVLQVLKASVDKLRNAGVKLTKGWPTGMDPSKMRDLYYRLLAANSSPTETEVSLGPLRTMTDGPWAHSAKLWLDGNAMSHKQWLADTETRLDIRHAWSEYIRSFDLSIMPANSITAFPHDHEKTFDERTLQTERGERPYGDIVRWACPATLTGCPATGAPVGQARQDCLWAVS